MEQQYSVTAMEDNDMTLLRFIVSALAVISFSAFGPQASAQTPVHDNSEIVMYGTDFEGKTAPLRRGYWNGATGAGADKIYHKHKINNFSLFTSTMTDPAAFKETNGGTAWVYFQAIGIMTCDETIAGQIPVGGCKDKKEDLLKLVVDHRTNTTFPTEDTTYGVVTLHCTAKGTEICDPWVNDTIAYPPQGKWPFQVS